MGAGSSSGGSSWSGYNNQLLSDTNKQTIFVEGSEEKNATAIIRDPAAKDGFQMYLTDIESKEELDSGWMCAQAAFRKFPDRRCFGYRPFTDPENDISQRGTYKFDTYATVAKQVYAVGNGLASLELAEKSNIGLFAINRAEWMTCHLANWSQSYRTVALYDTLGAQAVQYIVKHAELVVIFVEKNKLKALFDAIKISKDSNAELNLKYIVQFDYQEKYANKHEVIDEADTATAKEYGIELLGLTTLMEKGGDKQEVQKPKPEDLAYIMYTSGTTGDPKGVMLTHRCFACCVASSYRKLVKFGIPMGPEDQHVSYLPLAHSFESAVDIMAITCGASIAFWAGNIKTIARDWTEIRPTVMFGVPRIYNKTYDKIKLAVNGAGGLKKWMFDKAEKTSSELIRKGQRNGMYDSLVWSGVAEKLGFDRVKILASGAAPLPPHIAEFLKVACPKAVVVQGYGLTESCAVSFFTAFDDINLGHVGIPVDNLEYRLVDAPECDYLTTDKYPQGEVQLRGPTIMDGYFKNEEATKKSLSEDGWFSTGDIGRLNPNGTLSIIDRRKNMFKTAMGEYIAAEKVENVYGKAASANQIWIYGNSFKSFVVAVVVPDPLWLTPLLAEKGIWTAEDAKLTPATPDYCTRFKQVVADNYEAVKKIVVDDIKAVEQASDLKKFEKIKDYYIEGEVDQLLQGFNVANNTLTPTFKKKRPQLFKKYVDVLKEMYANNGEPAKPEENW